MRNKYEYLDPDFSYTDKVTGVLHNLAGLKNSQDLDFFKLLSELK